MWKKSPEALLLHYHDYSDTVGLINHHTNYMVVDMYVIKYSIPSLDCRDHYIITALVS